MEERYRSLTAGHAAKQQQQPGAAGSAGPPAEAAKPRVPAAAEEPAPEDASVSGKCACHRLAMHVLDISRAASADHVVEWLPFKSNASLAAPEETILYTLVYGRSELVHV
jgi:hypothetical protein